MNVRRSLWFVVPSVVASLWGRPGTGLGWFDEDVSGVDAVRGHRRARLRTALGCDRQANGCRRLARAGAVAVATAECRQRGCRQTGCQASCRRGTSWQAYRRSPSVPGKLDIHHETLRIWVRRAEVDQGTRPGLTTDERARMKELERENKELRRANEMAGGVGFLRGGARPPVQALIDFIDAHRERFGVEPICRVLREHGCGIAPNTYWAAKKRPPSERDAELIPLIEKIYEENLSVYGADKIWDQLNKDEVRVARCTVERLMRQIGLQGNRRGRTWTITTVGDERLDRPADLVDRDFNAPAPNRQAPTTASSWLRAFATSSSTARCTRPCARR